MLIIAYQAVSVKKALKMVKAELIHSEDVKQHKISSVSVQPTSQLTFTFGDTRTQTSVVKYFREKYDITLNFTALPALLAGSDSTPIYLPMEYHQLALAFSFLQLCKIVPGQRYSKRLNDRQVSALLKATCLRPNDRERSINQMVRHNNYNTDKFVNEFGLRVRTELTPKMVNGGKVKFLDSVRIWLTCARDFNPMPLLPIRSAHPAYIEKTLLEIHQQSNAQLASAGKLLQLLIIILPDATGTYGKIKRVCETELGIISQCCHPKQASKCQKQYLENVALKINVKAGGRNNGLLNALSRKIPYVTDMPTIIFGADVVHPQPGSNARPSIAAICCQHLLCDLLVVASMDWPEDPQRGMVHSGMIRELLIAFRRSTGHRSHRIIFYRDGVCEGQFNQVLLYEMDAIRKVYIIRLQSNFLNNHVFYFLFLYGTSFSRHVFHWRKIIYRQLPLW
ncbi:hypothetical protein HYC85_025167 [Camellia sinensis]|uniref:Piwi domain-containing protein n=1 Tax=Camellia sinensis TaxID=4442 RepID=A0A7J7GCF8_CAMSI|nr:hypothetical protein HYC85_025167 [Camellia sinensis]